MAGLMIRSLRLTGDGMSPENVMVKSVCLPRWLLMIMFSTILCAKPVVATETHNIAFSGTLVYY